MFCQRGKRKNEHHFKSTDLYDHSIITVSVMEEMINWYLYLFQRSCNVRTRNLLS